MRRVLVGMLLLLGATEVHAQLIFGWEYPRDLAAEAFILTADGPGGHLSWRTAPSPAGACMGDTSPDVYCTNLPQCPPQGAVTFEVAAVVQGEPSPPSTTRLPCQVTSQAPCRVQCEAPAETIPPPPGSVAQVPTTEEAAQSFEVGNGRVIVDKPPLPTRETARLPALQAMPALPTFQPAASRAPV